MLKNIISTFFTKGFIAVFNFLIMIISSRYLGGEVIGQVSLLILNIAIIQTVNEIFTGPTIVYFIPRGSLRKLYRQSILLVCLITIAINTLFYFARVGVSDLALHVFVLSFVITINSFHANILLAKERVASYNVVLLMQPVILLATLVASVLCLGIRGVGVYVLALYLSFGSSLIVSTILTSIEVSRDVSQGLPDLKSIFGKGIVNQLGNLAHTLSNRLNYYLLAGFGATLVGVYANATSMIEALWIVSGSASPILLTRVANQTDSRNDGRITFLLARICFLLSIVGVLTIALLPSSFFTFLLGKDFTQIKSVMLYLSPGVLFISFSSVISHYYSGLGRQRLLLLANSAGLMATLISSWFLVKSHGIYGACYVATLSYFMQALVLASVFMKEHKLSLKSFFKWKSDTDLLKR